MSNYQVMTNWGSVPVVGTLDSATFDTGTSTAGAQLNSVIWHGSLNGLLPGAVGFQFAVSNNPSSTWTFTGPLGTTSTNDVYVGSGNPNTPIPITNYTAYSGFRYFRYRIILQTNRAEHEPHRERRFRRLESLVLSFI